MDRLCYIFEGCFPRRGKSLGERICFVHKDSHKVGRVDGEKHKQSVSTVFPLHLR